MRFLREIWESVNYKNIKETKAWIDSHINTSSLNTPMPPEQFIEFCVSHGINIDNIVHDWVEDRDVSSYTLKDWIDLTLDTFKDHINTMIQYNSDGFYDKDIKNCQETVIKPLEKILNSND